MIGNKEPLIWTHGVGKKPVYEGQRFGQLVLITASGYEGKRKCVLVKCDCGKVARKGLHKITSGELKTCGHGRADVGRLRKRHGHCCGNVSSAEYVTWQQMIRRCRDPRNKRYESYGGRGITVCERWLLFDNFFEDMGMKPEAMSLDRIDPNGNYEPSNCRWASLKQQARNKVNTIWVKVDGKRISLSEYCEERGLKYHMVWTRIRKFGWSLEKATTTKARGSK